MSYLKIILLAVVLWSGSAAADIWKWVDADGVTHLVDTDTPIYTWIDESGKIFYSDTPDHEDAIAVQLVWHSGGSLADAVAKEEAGKSRAVPGETDQQRLAREGAEAYYCERATEIYNSYKGAPRLYKTNDAGEREYLSEEEAEATMTATKDKMDELCS
jgi:hypothetical protein